MADKNTLLSYQTSWEFRFFDLMAASQQVGDYVMACVWGESWLILLGLSDKIPEKKVPLKSGSGAEMSTWQSHFANILQVGVGKVKSTIDDVRKTYRPEMNIPKYTKTQAVTN